MLSLKNISKIYSRKQSQEDVVALSNVSIDLPNHGFVAILGASGSGKTTLLNIVGGLDKATSGNMIVDGLSTNEFSAKDWDSYRNQKIGFVLQNCYLLPHLNVRDNVAVKLQISHSSNKDIDALVDDALRRVDLLDKKFDKPKALSGGQKQRVAIARALVGNPTVILADEPTGALDSKTGTSIMELLKEASKDHLVVMVTHNNEYASKYADRVIELKDGEVINDSAPVKNEAINNPKELGRVSIPPKTTLKWGFKNLIVKKFSTLSIILAASLGLAGVGIILSVSTGVQHVFDEVEASSFSKYPVQFRTSANNTPQATGEDYEEYTDDETVYVDYSSYYLQEHFEYMSDEFLTYMRSMPEQYYIGTFEVAYTAFNMYTKRNDSSYPKVSSTYLFYKGADSEDFMETQFDCLKGSFPKEANELALVVDKCNRVNVSYLYSLGFDVDTTQIKEDDSFTFEQILSKTYKYVSNNDYYQYDSGSGRYLVTTKTNKELYESSTVTLKISGIIRQKKDNNDPIITSGVIYSHAFENYVLDNANHSDVVVAQKANPTINVNTGATFTDTATKTATYFYEQQLYQLGSLEQVRGLNYYTNDYDSRVKIKEYFKAYHYDKDAEPCYVSPYDYLESASQKFDGALSLMTSVLYVFAVVTVVVSALLNGILTFISIRQRTNEIGLLRSLGARKADIATMIETESLICGIFGGLFSILISIILIAPINALVTRAIKDYKFYLIYDKKFTLEGYQWWVAPICIGLGLATALISALIPAILASRKDPAKAINE